MTLELGGSQLHGVGLVKTRNSPEFAFTFVAPDIVSPILGVRGVGHLVKEVGNLT